MGFFFFYFFRLFCLFSSDIFFHGKGFFRSSFLFFPLGARRCHSRSGQSRYHFLSAGGRYCFLQLFAKMRSAAFRHTPCRCAACRAVRCVSLIPAASKLPQIGLAFFFRLCYNEISKDKKCRNPEAQYDKKPF